MTLDNYLKMLLEMMHKEDSPEASVIVTLQTGEVLRLSVMIAPDRESLDEMIRESEE